MPIYEFYCVDCHTVYNFLSRGVNTRKRPKCPGCGRPRLERRASAFAISSGRPESEADEALPAGFDEARMESVMESLAHEAESVNEDDPRAVAGLMRRFYNDTGLEVGGGMEEALRRLESGENPEAIEAEMGDVLENEDPFESGGGLGLHGLRRRLKPRVDPTLHEL